MLEFKQSEQNTVRRQWLFQLIGQIVNNEVPAGATPGTSFTLAYLPDANSLKLTNNGQLLTGGGVDYTLVSQTLTMVNTVGATDVFLASYSVPALTGQTGKGYVSKNGATAVQTTNSMVEIDATNMPGFYYIALTAGELDTLGFIGLRVKTAQSLEYQDKALVSYNDPYASQGGFVAPSNATGMSTGITKTQADDLLKKIRKMIAEEFAKDEEEDDAEEIVEQKDYTEKLDAIMAQCQAMQDSMDDMEMPEMDLTPVMEAIGKLPKPNDYSKDFIGLQATITATLPVVTEFATAVNEFENKLSVSGKDFTAISTELTTLKTSFEALTKTMEDYKATLADQSDLDKRMDTMVSGKNQAKMDEFSKKFVELQTQFVNFKYDVLEMLKFGKITKK